MAIFVTNPKRNGNFPLMTLTLDKMNRLVVPKQLRERIALQAGDDLEVTLEAEGFKLRPLHLASPLATEAGVLVCSSELPSSAWDIGALIDQQRDQRSRNLGGL